MTVANWRIYIAKEDLKSISAEGTARVEEGEQTGSTYSFAESDCSRILEDLTSAGLENDGMQILSFCEKLREKDPSFDYKIRQGEDTSAIMW
tara:strand:+ start:1862 stop:2137 length:276 start_codon:yes stop_codon:yes gene_type:complete